MKNEMTCIVHMTCKFLCIVERQLTVWLSSLIYKREGGLSAKSGMAQLKEISPHSTDYQHHSKDNPHSHDYDQHLNINSFVYTDRIWFLSIYRILSS